MYFRVFDCWRFIAAILIMTYHYLYWGPSGSERAIDVLYRLLPLLDMFFMISGFFITSRYAKSVRTLSDYGAFFRRRFARLYPLHLLTTLFFLGAAIFAWSIDARHYPYAIEFAAFPYHLLGLHALGFTDELALNYVSWSVSAELFSYALFPVIVVALHKGGVPALLAIVLAYLGALELASHLGVFPSGHWTTADTCGAYRAFFDFMVGGLVARLVAERYVRIGTPLPGIALMIAALAAMLAATPWYVVFAPMIASLYLSAVAETENPRSTDAVRFAMPLTAAAFGVYIWHPILEFFFLRVVWDQWLARTGAVDFYAFMTVPMVATVVVAVLSLRHLEPKLSAFVTGPRPAGLPKTGAIASR